MKKYKLGHWSILANVKVEATDVTWKYTTTLERDGSVLLVFHQKKQLDEDQIFDLIIDRHSYLTECEVWNIV